MYVELLRISQQKITEAEQSQGQQMFDTVARELLDWTNRMSAVLNEPIPTSAQDEEVLKHHNDIEDQIKVNIVNTYGPNIYDL
jgi:hypothetical protein